MSISHIRIFRNIRYDPFVLSEDEGWLSVTQAATYCGVAPITVRRWIAAGRLPATRVGPKLLKVQQADLDKMLRQA